MLKSKFDPTAPNRHFLSAGPVDLKPGDVLTVRKPNRIVRNQVTMEREEVVKGRSVGTIRVVERIGGGVFGKAPYYTAEIASGEISRGDIVLMP